LTRKLEAALRGTNPANPYRVVVFSFDPLETAESLRLYRMHEQLPANWKMVRSNEAEIRRFFGFFGYSVMDQNGTLIHPNEVFLLDQALNWRWALVGEDWSGGELATAINRTRSSGPAVWIKANPEKLAWIGLATVVLSIGLALVWMIYRKSTNPLGARAAEPSICNSADGRSRSLRL